MILLTCHIGYILQIWSFQKPPFSGELVTYQNFPKRFGLLVYFIVTFSHSDKCLIIICSSIKVVSDNMCKSNKLKHYKLLVFYSGWHLWHSLINNLVHLETMMKRASLLLGLFSPKGYARQLLTFNKVNKSKAVTLHFVLLL